MGNTGTLCYLCDFSVNLKLLKNKKFMKNGFFKASRLKKKQFIDKNNGENESVPSETMESTRKENDNEMKSCQ